MNGRERLPRNGYSINEAAKKLGLSPRTVARWTSTPREEYLAAAGSRHQTIRELREQGLSMRAIAAELEVSVGTVHYALHKDAESA